MNVRSKVAACVVAMGLVATVAGSTGCSSAPGDEGVSTTQELKYCPDPPCDPLPPPPPPPPTNVCAYDAIARANDHVNYPGGGTNFDPSSGFPGAPSYYHHDYGSFCIMSNDTDPLRVKQRTLMTAYSCSRPFYWEAFNAANGFAPGYGPSGCENSSTGVIGPGHYSDGMFVWACWNDKANGVIQLCPDTAAVSSYVNGIGRLFYAGPQGWQQSDIPARISRGGTAVPTAPTGYTWVTTWEDPHACVGGCMCEI